MRNKDYFQLFLLIFFFGFLLLACKTDTEAAMENLEFNEMNQVELRDSEDFVQAAYLPPSGWTEIGKAQGFAVDIKYASDSNFTGKIIYDCPKCILREDVADYLVLLQDHLKSNYGLGIKVFDCYRPKAYQQRLWDAVPDASYVTPPAKGSMHSRGMAVDLTLVDSLGNELDMGTAYDYFGKEAHIDYEELPKQVLDNRQFLRDKMIAYGFEPIRTEWWHFSFTRRTYKLAEFVWSCD